MAMKDVKTAADLRTVIEKIVTKVIDRERPPIRIGRVFSFNRDTSVAMVLFPGNTIDGLVPASFGKNMIPSVAMIDTFDTDGYNAAGDVVRVAGKPNDWYILGYSVGIPVSEHTDNTAIKGAYEDNVICTGSGVETLYLTYTPVEHSEHLYWNGVYQNKDQWTRDGTTVTVLDPSNLIKAGDELVMEYLYIDPAVRPIIPGTATYVGITATNSPASSLALPAGTLPGDLLVMTLVSKVASGSVDTRLPNQYYTPYKTFAYGYADSSTSAVPITLTGDSFGFACGTLAAYRVTGQVVPVFTPNTANPPSGSYISPPMPMGCSAGISAIGAGIVGVVPNGVGATDINGNWHRDGGADSSFENVHNAHCSTGTPDAAWGRLSGGEWASLVIGLKDL